MEMASPPELAADDATALDAQIRAGQLTATDALTASLHRIDSLNPSLNAVVLVARESALDAARKSDERIAAGDPRPLEGVPVAIKDDTIVAGLPVSEGTASVPATTYDADATLVARLRDAGAVIVAKTNLPEFGTIAVTENRHFGPCRNPWDLARNSGGSSGGSAVAVATGMVAAAHGCDGGGSLRIPAACCGIFTMKPSRGRVSTAPYFGESALNVHGFLTRSVRDNALLLDTVHGPMAGDHFAAPPPVQPYTDEVAGASKAGRLRVGWTVEPPFDVPVHASHAEAVAEAASLCASLGHTVERTTVAWSRPENREEFLDLWAVAIGWYVEYLLDNGADRDAIEPHNLAIHERSRSISATQAVRGWARWRTFLRTMLRSWDEFDVVLTPTLARPAPLLGEFFDNPARPVSVLENAFAFTPFTPLVNVSGQPAAQIPFAHLDGLPVGVQAIGRYGDEAALFRLAAEFEAARPWKDRRPPQPRDVAAMPSGERPR